MNSNQPATTYNSGDDTSSLALSYGNHPPADEMFAQDTLDAHWNPNRSSQFETDFVMPAMALLPQSNVVSAFFIDSKGEILPVEQQVSSRTYLSTYSDPHATKSRLNHIAIRCVSDSRFCMLQSLYIVQQAACHVWGWSAVIYWFPCPGRPHLAILRT